MTEVLTHANIVQLLGIESLPLDQRKEIVESAIELVEDRTLARILENLGDEDKNSFLEAMESKNEVVVSEFLEEKSLDILKLMEEEAEKVKKELLDLTHIK